jgi:thiamine biosynthesis lipoprotein
MHRRLSKENAMNALLSPRRRSLMLGAAGAIALAGCGRPAGRAELHFAGETMGTTYNVKVARWSQPGRLPELHEAVQAAFDGVNGSMSLHRADSELARFNRAAGEVALSEDLWRVVAAGQEVASATDGAFDMTVAPLVVRWGFGPAPRGRMPQGEEIRTIRARIGHQALQVDRARRLAVKRRPDLEIDLGGIAKGYGVDLAARALDAAGAEHYLVEAGGEVFTRGVNGEGQPWRIGIEQPDAMPPRARLVVPFSGQAMATSGDYRNYFEADGRRYSHEIDPRTGAPVDHRLCSVTVVAQNCMRADALATALLVLGPDRGMRLAESLGLAAYFVERLAPGQYRDDQTGAFAALGSLAA